MHHPSEHRRVHVQNAVKELCGVREKLTGGLDADQLAEATRHIDALVHPLRPDDIRALWARQLLGTLRTVQRSTGCGVPASVESKSSSDRSTPSL